MTEMPPMMTEPVENKPSSAMAVAALVLSIWGLIPCIGIVPCLVGIVLGIIALSSKAGGKGIAVTAVIVGIAVIIIYVLVVVAFVFSALGPMGEIGDRTICTMNLHGIGQAVAAYQGENDDQFPPTLQHLIDAGQDEDLFICPATGNTEPFDYFYNPPAALSAGEEAETLIACDFAGNHPGKIRSVLYADGTVTWLEEEDLQAELAKPHNAEFAAALTAAEEAR